MTVASEVLGGSARWSCECADCLGWLTALPDNSIDLLFCSPPYLKARTYGRTDVARGLDEWVAWMVEFVRAASPKVKGLIAINCEGQTSDFRYLPAPFLLAADLHRAGFNLRKPPIFHRVGIPGSGGPDWLRNDYEPIVCVTRPGKLPWSDNTACGHPPKWAPGGEMSHMLSDGTRVNQWGKTGSATGAGNKDADGNIKPNGKARPSHKTTSKRMPGGEMREQSYDAPALANPGNVIEPNIGAFELASILEEYGHAIGDGPDEVLRELRQASRSEAIPQWFQGVIARTISASLLRPSLQGYLSVARESSERSQGEGAKAGSQDSAANRLQNVWPNDSAGSSSQGREPYEQQLGQLGGSLPLVPQAGTQAHEVLSSRMLVALQGSGLLQQALVQVQDTWRSVGEMLRQRQAEACGSVISLRVGGGAMGHPAAQSNEAPYPLDLPAFFVKSFCPPDGVVCDPFSGSGTTAHAAFENGRRFVGCDLRQSQVDLCGRRLATVAPDMFSGLDAA